MEIEEFTKQNKKYCKQFIIGESEKKRPIYALMLKKGKGQRKKAFLISHIHGNEPASLKTNLGSLENILNKDLLRHWKIISIPVANPDGKASGERCNAKGIDLNRDFNQKKAKETNAIINMYNKFKPEAAIDYHSSILDDTSCIILPSKIILPCKTCNSDLFKNIISQYQGERENPRLGTGTFMEDHKGEIIGTLLSLGIHRIDKDLGAFTDYAIKTSKIALAIEDNYADFGVEFSTELLSYLK